MNGTDSANEDETSEHARNDSINIVRLHYISALEEALAIEKKRTERYETMAYKTLEMVNSILKEFRAHKNFEKEQETLLYQKATELDKHRKYMITSAGERSEEMRVVANAITLYTMEVCSYDDEIDPVNEFYRILNIFQKLGLQIM